MRAFYLSGVADPRRHVPRRHVLGRVLDVAGLVVEEEVGLELAQELGYLVGLSRQRVNEALQALQGRALIRIEYGGVRVLDLDGLRRHVQR